MRRDGARRPRRVRRRDTEDRRQGAWHFYNLVGGKRVDFTASQFESPIGYDDLPSNRDEALSDTSAEQYQLLRERVSANNRA